jgi:hypothetical protein
MRLRPFRATFVVAVVGVFVPHVDAHAGDLELRYESKPTCPTQAAVRAAIRALAPEPPPDDVVVDARINALRDSIGYRLELETTVGNRVETLELESPDCRVLADAVALLTAIAIDPVAATRAAWSTRWSLEQAANSGADLGAPVVPEPPKQIDAPPETSGDGPREASSAGTNEGPFAAPVDTGGRALPGASALTPTLPEPEDLAAEGGPDRLGGLDRLVPGPTPPRTRRPLGAMLRFGGGGDFGSMARATGQVGGAIGLGIGSARVEAHAAWLTPIVEQYATGDQLQMRIQTWAVGLGGCWAPAVGSRLQILLCGRAEVGESLARAVDFDSSGRSVWVGAIVSPGIAVRIIDALAFVAFTDVVGVMRRPAFHLQDRGVPLFQAGPVGFRPAIGLEARFGARNGVDPATNG